MTAIIRREMRRTVGAYSSGGGVYRRPVFIVRSFPVAVSTGVQIVQPAAAEVVVEGTSIGPMFNPRPADVIVEGAAVGILTNGQASVTPGAADVVVDGPRPIIFKPGDLRMILSASRRRREQMSRYGQTYPAPDYDVVLTAAYQPLPYRIVQIGLGDVVVDGGSVGLLIDAGRYVEAGSGEVVVEGGAVTLLAAVYVDAGPAEVVVEGGQAKTSEIAGVVTPGAGDIEVVGYNPSVIAVGAYYRQDQASADWTLADTAVQSWSDVSIVTTIWRKQ